LANLGRIQEENLGGWIVGDSQKDEEKGNFAQN
jgi:hypothetical protein